MNNVNPLVRTAGLTVFLCVLAALCEGIDLQAAGIAAGGVRAELKPIAGELGNFLSASTLGLFLGALVGGRLSDVLGRKKVLVTSVAVFGVFSILNALAHDMATLTWMRLLTGFGLGGALPNVLALVSESSAPNRRNANVALAYSGMPLGGALISWISLGLASTQWRPIFIVAGVVPLLIVPFMARYVRESSAFLSARAALPAGAQTPERISISAVMTHGRALRTLLLWVSFFFGLLTLYLLLNWLPTLMVESGLSVHAAGLAQIGFNVGGALAAYLIGRCLEGRARLPSVVIAFVALPLLLYRLAMAPPELAELMLVIFALGAALMAAQAFLYAVAPACYPTVIRGLGVGLAVAIGRIGSIAGPKLGGIWKAEGLDTSHLLLKLLPIVIAGSITAIVLAYTTPREDRS